MRSVPTSPHAPHYTLMTPKIFSHIAVPILNHENHDRQHSRDDQLHLFDILCGVGCENFEKGFTLSPKPGDLALRLVSTSFNRAFTRAFFRREYAFFPAYRSNSVQLLREYLLDGKTTFAPLITRLHIELAADIQYRGKEFFEEGHTAKDCSVLDASPKHVVPFCNTLNDAIAKVPKLERLVVNLKGQWRSDGPMWDELESDEGGDEDVDVERHGPVYDLELLHQMRIGLANIVSCVDNNLEFLTYLRLTLPCAYDFAIIGGRISDAMASRLRHLYLEYIDGTGPGGDLYYTRSWQGDEDSDGDEDYPYSNLQRKFPNLEYMKDVCRLVQRCRNLESWGFAGTQCLQLSTLEWQPADEGLKTIYIRRATTTCEKLLQLLVSSDGSSSDLRAFEIDEVRLLDGTWADIFKALSDCAALRYIHVHNLVYAREGTSAHLAERNGRPWENYNYMWTEHEEDKERLYALVMQVQERGGGASSEMKVFVEDWEEWLSQSPLEGNAREGGFQGLSDGFVAASDEEDADVEDADEAHADMKNSDDEDVDEEDAADVDQSPKH